MSVPVFYYKHMAYVARERVQGFFKVTCEVVLDQPDPEMELNLLKALESVPPDERSKMYPSDRLMKTGYRLEIPDGVIGAQRFAIEQFLIAYGYGWEDGLVSNNKLEP